MKTKRFTPFILAGVLAGSLSGCMAMTDGIDTVSGGVYSTYYPYGTPAYVPDYYGYYNPVVAPPPSSRPVSGPPAWGYPAGAPGRPNATPVRPAPAPAPSPSPGGGSVAPKPTPSPGTPSRPSSGSSNGQRPGANVIHNNRPAPASPSSSSSSGGASSSHNSGSRR